MMETLITIAETLVLLVGSAALFIVFVEVLRDELILIACFGILIYTVLKATAIT